MFLQKLRKLLANIMWVQTKTLMMFKLVRLLNYICTDFILYKNHLALDVFDGNCKQRGSKPFFYNCNVGV